MCVFPRRPGGAEGGVRRGGTSRPSLVVLNAGCGTQGVPVERFPRPEWRELRLDADPGVTPDVVGDIRQIPLDEGTVNAVWCAHTLEHLIERDALVALYQFRRVLVPGGALVLRVPDLKAAAREIVEGRLVETLYESQAGPVRPLDMVFGFQPYVPDHPLYAHRSGYTGESLSDMLGFVGFEGTVTEVEDRYELAADVHKPLGEHERHREQPFATAG